MKQILQNKQTIPRKRGAPLGNRNAAGHGAPRGNKNAVGHGAPMHNANAMTHGAYSSIGIPDLKRGLLWVSHGRGSAIYLYKLTSYETLGISIKTTGKLFGRITFFPNLGQRITFYQLDEVDPNTAKPIRTLYRGYDGKWSKKAQTEAMAKE